MGSSVPSSYSRTSHEPGKSSDPISKRSSDKHRIRDLLLLEVKLNLSFGEQRTLFVFDLGGVVSELARDEQLDASLACRDGIDERLLDRHGGGGQGRDEDIRVLEFSDELGLIRVVDGNDGDSEIGELLGRGRLDLRAKSQSRASAGSRLLTDSGRANTLTCTPGTLIKFLTIRFPMLAEPGFPPPRPPATANDLYDMLERARLW